MHYLCPLKIHTLSISDKKLFLTIWGGGTVSVKIFSTWGKTFYPRIIIDRYVVVKTGLCLGLNFNSCAA